MRPASTFSIIQLSNSRILCGLSLILADIVILVYVEHSIFTDLLGILMVAALVWVGSTFRELRK